MSRAGTARFQVDPRLATLLGEGYRSSEQALKELVDNAWDADAGRVTVTLPAPMTTEPLVIEDDGSGMTEPEIRQEYLVVANDRRTRKGERTQLRQRLVKGRKGIGKFAGLMVADVMTLETAARGVLTRVVIRKEDLLRPERDLEKIDIPITTEPCATERHGTTITLNSLNQHLAFPTAERLKQILVLDYGRQDDFAITVNGDPVGIEDIPGRQIDEMIELPGVGPVRLRATIADGKKPLKQSGIVIRVDGKAVGKPVHFGLEQNEMIPPKLLKRVYGEIEANGLADDVTADWGAIVENSRALGEVEAWAGATLTHHMTDTFKTEVSLAKARRAKELKRRLGELPEYRRQLAEEAIERVLGRFYGESEDRIDAVMGVMLDAFEHDDYWVVVSAIDRARDTDIATLAEAVNQFGLVDMALIGQQARRRLEVLDRLDDLLVRRETLESEVHRMLEHNLWVLGAEYSLLTSNKTLKRIAEELAQQAMEGSRAKMRPDLLLTEGVHNRRVLIEFKRPAHQITRDDEAQATKYRDDLHKLNLGPVHIIVIGGGHAPSVDPRYQHPDFAVQSYAGVVSRARTELQWLVGQLSRDSADAA